MSKKFSTKESFLDFLDSEFAWRIRELSTVKKAAMTAKDKIINTEIRKGILLLYAHWEGFIKIASIKFLQYIVDQKFKKSELTDNYKCLMFRKHFQQCADSQRINIHIKAVHHLLDNPDEPVIFCPEGQIKTQANLNYELFQNILQILAIDPKPYEMRKNQIDESLLERRNSIAHGEYLSILPKQFEELYEGIIELIRSYKIDIENLCIAEGFKKKEP